MANTLRFKRGIASGIPTALAGEPLFTTDTFDLYIGNGTTNTRFQKYIASGATTQILRGDGSLYTFPLAISSPSTGQVLKYNGTSWVNDSDAGITGSGSAGQVAYFTGATTQAGSNNLFWDTTNLRLGVGTNTPNSKLEVYSSTGYNFIRSVGLLGSYFESYSTTGVRSGSFGSEANGDTYAGSRSNNPFILISNATERARIFATGNFGINTGASDSGQRLQVIGDTLLKGSGNTSATTALTVQNSDGNNILRLRNDFTAIFDVAGSSLTISGIANYTILQANQAFYFRSNGATAGRAFKIFDNASSLTGTTGANQNIQSLITFAPTSGTATYTDLDLTSTINQTGGANGITRGLYVRPTLTAAADWRSIEWSNNSGWGLYGAGTANNYMAGDLRIGSTSDITGVSKIFTSFSSQVAYGITFNNTYTAAVNNGYFLRAYNNGTEMFGINFQNETTSNPNIAYRNSLTFSNGLPTGTERMRLDASGNLGLGVTPSAWGGPFKVMQLGTYGQYIAGQTNNADMKIGMNSYYNGTNYIYTNSGSVTLRYDFSANGYAWQIAPSGTAGNAITFTQAMTLDASGRLGIGTTAPAVALEIAGASTQQVRVTSTSGADMRINADTVGRVGTYSNSNLAVITNSSPIATFFTTGNLALNSVTDSGEKLQVTGTAKITGATSFGGITTITTGSVPFYGIRILNYSGLTTDRQLFFGVVDDSFQTIGNSYYQNSNQFRTTTTTGSFIDFSQGRLRVYTDSGLTANTSYTPTLRATIDTSGNLGLGVTPSAWDSTYRVYEAPGNAFFAGFSGQVQIGQNGYYSGAWKYKTTAVASKYYQVSGTHVWQTAPSGTADTNITYTQAMILDASGNLAIGIATASSRVHVDAAAGSSHIRWSEAGTTRGFVGGANGIATSLNGYFMVRGEAGLVLSGNGNSSDLIIRPTSANILIGSTSDSGERLQVTGTAKITGATSITNTMTARQVIVDGANNSNISRINLTRTDASWGVYNETDFRIYYSTGNTITPTTQYFSLGSGTGLATFSNAVTIGGNLTVDTNTLFVDATNNEVGIGTTSPNSTLHVSGSVTTAIVAKTANYTATVSDYTILCDTTGGGFTITLPAANTCTGRIYVIKKVIGNSGLNNVTIDGNGAETIDGAATLILQCKSSAMIQSDGANWYILALYSDASCL